MRSMFGSACAVCVVTTPVRYRRLDSACERPRKELIRAINLAVTSMLLQKRGPLPVDKAHLLHVNRLPYHSIYLVKRDSPPAVKPTPVLIEKPDLLPVDNF